MYIFGGFSSVLLNDILVYKPPNCKAFRNEELCKNAGPGIKCIWNKNYCESWESGNTNNILRAKCPPKTVKCCVFPFLPPVSDMSFSTRLKHKCTLLIRSTLVAFRNKNRIIL